MSRLVVSQDDLQRQLFTLRDFSGRHNLHGHDRAACPFIGNLGDLNRSLQPFLGEGDVLFVPL